jgi:rhizosphere induced protein
MKYTIQFQNNSGAAASIMLFQQEPKMENLGLMPLAWFTKYVHPATHGYFNWDMEYNFVWAETGILVSGVYFISSQEVVADLIINNQITFRHDRGYFFDNQTTGSQQNSLTINQDSSIPMNMASVGIGMSGAATFAIQAQPNITITITPHPEFWISFGNFDQGLVLKAEQITTKAQVVFPANIYDMTAILNADFTWTVIPTIKANENFIAALKDDENAILGE